MNDISKFNNKYLKCIVTKYPATTGYLANSGALIIYQPNSGLSINRNYIYLGDEFLASGYGFSTEDIQREAERIVLNYDSQINELKNADRDLDAKIDDEVDNVKEELKKYVLINGGYIDETKININGNDIKTKDVLLHGEEAQYKNLEVTNVDVKINGESLNGNNIYLPLGSLIKNIDIYVEYNINDSGGIYKVEAIHKNLNYINNNDLDDDEQIESVIINYDEDDNGLAREGIIHYHKSFNDDLYVLNKIEGIISGFNIYVSETPVYKYKNYPRIESVLGIEIKSVGNMIIKNIITVLKDINVIPYYTLHYQYDTLNYTIENNRIQIDKDIITIKSILPTNKTLYIAIPTVYHLDKIYAISNNDEKFNWTGAVYVKPNVDLISYSDENVEHKYATKYNIYVIFAQSGFKCKKFELKLSKLNETDSYVISEVSDHRPPLIISPDDNNSYTLNDEEFNNIYWVLYNNEFNEAEFRDALDDVTKTCAK